MVNVQTRIRQWAEAADHLNEAKRAAYGPGGSADRYGGVIRDLAQRRAVRYWGLRYHVATDRLRGVVGLSCGIAPSER